MRALLLAVVVALILTGGALADHLDPQERIREGDQKRAGAMVLRKADLPAGFAPERTSGLEPHFTCPALDESDLVLTGKATSPFWAREYQIVGSSSAIYRTADDSRAAWRRTTSESGLDCLRDGFRSELARQGEVVRVTTRELSFPKLAVVARAYRLSFSATSPPGQAPLFFVDVVALMQGRAQAGLVFAGIVAPPARATEVSLARVVATRMRAALRTG